jgi:hypothetical protein
MSKKASLNDQRSNVKNPNNPAKTAANNRSDQMDPHNPASKRERSSIGLVSSLRERTKMSASQCS